MGLQFSYELGPSLLFPICVVCEVGMQSQVVYSGCRSLLMYPSGATNVCCTLCSTITNVPPPGMEMAQLICGGSRTLLMYTRGATSVRCSCCHTVNLAPGITQFPEPNCCRGKPYVRRQEWETGYIFHF